MTAAESESSDPPVRIGIPERLRGGPAAPDGRCTPNRFLAETFGRFVDWVMLGPDLESCRQSLTTEGLIGYIVEERSRDRLVPVVATMFPYLPTEEERALSDPVRREHFIERVLAYGRLQRLFAGQWTAASLMQFHAAHKLILMAHSPAAATALGRIAANATVEAEDATEHRYREGFMTALEQTATTGRHTNVLQHIAGYFTEHLDAVSRRDLSAVIEDYRLGRVPRIVPVTLIRRHVQALQIKYLADQLYLSPHPLQSAAK
jgi:uncharacterized protein YbgA (DUF1722 family)